MDKIVLLLVFLGVVFSSCSKKTYPSYQTIDTFWVEEIVVERDTSIVVPSAMVGIELDSLSEFVKHDQQAKLEVRKTKEGRWNIACECDTLSIVARLRDKNKTTSHKKLEQEVIIERERYTPSIVLYLAVLGVATIVYFIIKLILKRK